MVPSLICSSELNSDKIPGQNDDEMILAIIFIGRLRTLLAHFVSGFLVDVMIRPGRAVIWRLLCRASNEDSQRFYNLLVESVLTLKKYT